MNEKQDSIISMYILIIKNILLIMLFIIISIFFITSGAICIIGTVCSFFNIEGITFEGINIWVTRVIITALGLLLIRYGYKFAKYTLKVVSRNNKLFISNLQKNIKR